MSTKTTDTKLSPQEIKYNQRVKSVELAIRSQKGGITSDTLMKVAEKIYSYLKQ